MSNVAAGKDTDDEGEVLNDVEKTLNSLNIALRSSKGEWRSFEDVLDEVAAKWKSFSDTERSHIATAIAGTRQQENFRAMMNNWDEVTRLVGVAADSTGSASERMEVYLDSIEAKTNKLKASWENFVMSLNQNESWGELLDWLSQFLDKLQYVDWKLVGITAGIGGIITMILKLLPAIKTLITTIKTGGILAGISSGGIIPILGLIATAIITISTAWKSANENAEQQINAIKEQKDALDEEEDNAKSLMKTYNDLMSKKSVYGLTQEEKQKLVDVSTELVKQYGFEYDGIDNLTGAYKIATGAVNDYTESLKKQREEYSKESREKRRKDIDDRSQKLSWNDEEFTTAERLRKLGKDFDTDLYYTYVKERESIIGEIQEQMSEIFSDSLSSNTKNLILGQIKNNASNLTGEEIKNKFTDDYLSKLNNFAESYDSVISKIYANENKFQNLIDKNGFLSLEDTREYKKTLEDRLAIYQEMKNKELITAEEYNQQVTALEEEVNSRLDFAFVAISDSLGENASKFNVLAQNVLGLTQELKTGEKGIQDYVTSLSTLAENLDLKDIFGDNTEASLKFFSTLSTQLTNVLNLIKSNYEGGVYSSNNDYINDLISWGEAIQRLGNKMSTIDGANPQAKGSNNVSSANNIATIRNGDSTSYIMTKNEFDKQQRIQQNVAKAYSIWESYKKNRTEDAFGDDYSLVWAMRDKVEENDKNGKGRGLFEDDYLNYLKEHVEDGEEVVARYKEISEKAKNSVDTESVWNQETNKYNEQNTEIKGYIDYYTDQINKLEEKKQQLQEKANDIAKNSIVKLENNESYQKVQKQIKETEDAIKEYQDKINNTSKDEDDFQQAVDNTNASLVEQEDAATEMSSAAKDIAEAIKGLKELQDSISAIEGINSGTIVEGSAEFGSAIKTIAEDVYTSVRDTSGNIKQEYIDIYGETSALFSGTVDDLVTAYQNGEITIEQFEAVLKQSVQDNINKLKNGIGDFLIGVGKQFENFEVTLKITMNTGNIADKIKNAIAGITGQDINVGEIKIASDAASNTLSTLGNAIKNTPLEFDFSYTPSNKDNIGGKTSGKPNSYTPSGGGSKNKKGSGSEYSAEDAASDLKDILQDIEDYEADIELDLEDQTEQLINQYNLKRNQLDSLKEELDYYDSIYDVTENTTKWLETQLKILDEESKKVAEIQNANDKIDKQRQKIYNENSSLNVQSWFDSEGNETLAYGNLLNSFEYRKNEIEKETAAAMRAEYNKVANSTDKDTISAAKDRIKQIEKDGDIKIKAIDKERDKVENIYDSVSQLNDAWKENQEAIREALQELNDKVKSIRDELIDDIMEQLERAVDKMNTSIEKDVTRLEQLKQVQESYNDILNDTIDTQQELEDELKANMDSYQYLDDTMRQLMFNEDDYKQLSGVIEGIQSDIAGIWEDHYNQIQNLTEDEMYKAEYITNETERQLAAKQKEYDLAKAELDVAKAQTNLNNVKNERNTRIFANGEWQWVANPDDVKSAQQQLMEAEREKTRLEREAEQQLLIDAMDKMIDSDNLQIDKNNELLENIQDAIEKETEEVKSIEEALLNADKANLPALTTTLIGALGSDGGYMKELLGEINHSQVELAAALRGQTVQQAIDQLKSGTMSQSEFEELTKRLGFSFNPTTGMVTTQDGSFAAHYKGWVKKSNSDTQLGTAANGVQVTGGQAGSGQANAATSGGNGGGSSFPRNGRVTTSSLPLRIRSGAGTQYKILGTMPKGANVTILGEANSGWAQVRYGGITGYASRQYLHYDQGGIASGIGYMPKATLKPERVLSPRQTKAFEKLVNNITTNPVLNALSRIPSVNSKLGNLAGETNNSKNYYFSNFTVQADDIQQFINSIETIMPINNK